MPLWQNRTAELLFNPGCCTGGACACFSATVPGGGQPSSVVTLAARRQGVRQERVCSRRPGRNRLRTARGRSELGLDEAQLVAEDVQQRRLAGTGYRDWLRSRSASHRNSLAPWGRESSAGYITDRCYRAGRPWSCLILRKVGLIFACRPPRCRVPSTPAGPASPGQSRTRWTCPLPAKLSVQPSGAVPRPEARAGSVQDCRADAEGLPARRAQPLGHPGCVRRRGDDGHRRRGGAPGRAGRQPGGATAHSQTPPVVRVDGGRCKAWSFRLAEHPVFGLGHPVVYWVEVWFLGRPTGDSERVLRRHAAVQTDNLVSDA